MSGSICLERSDRFAGPQTLANPFILKANDAALSGLVRAKFAVKFTFHGPWTFGLSGPRISQICRCMIDGEVPRLSSGSNSYAEPLPARRKVKASFIRVYLDGPSETEPSQ